MSDLTASAVYHEVFLALAHEASDEAFFGLLAEKTRLLTGSETAAVALLDAERANVTLAGVSGESAGELRGTRVAASDSVAGPTALTGETHLSYRSEGRSAAIVPIFACSRSVGALASLNKPDPDGFSGDDLLVLHTLAAAAAARVGARDRRRSTEGAARRLAAADEALAALTDGETLSESLDGFAALARDHLDADGIAILLADDEGRALHVAAESGLPAELLERGVPDAGIEAWCAGSELFVLEMAPLRRGERSLGTLVALGRTPSLDATRTQIAGALARQASLAIECAILREEVARRGDEATALYELSQAVGATLKMPQVLSRAADAARAHLAVEKVALFLREPTGERLRLAVERGFEPGAEYRLRPAVGQGLPGWVVQFQTPTASSDLAADLRNAGFPLEGEGVASLVAAPLQVGTETLGVLCGLTARPRRFTVAEIELAYTIANQTAAALENARAYAETRRQSIALRRYLQGVARAVSSPKAAAQVPEVVVSLTRDALGADRVALYLIEPKGEGTLVLRTLAAAGHRAAEPWLLSDTGDSPAAWVARKGRALHAPSTAADPRFGTKWERPRSGAYAAAPLKGESGIVLGVLEIWRRSPAAFDRRSDLRQLSALAKHAALALEGAQRKRNR